MWLKQLLTPGAHPERSNMLELFTSEPGIESFGVFLISTEPACASTYGNDIRSPCFELQGLGHSAADQEQFFVVIYIDL